MKTLLALLFISFSCTAQQYDEADALFSAEDYAQEYSHHQVVRVKPHKEEEKKVIVVTQEELNRVLKSIKDKDSNHGISSRKEQRH